MSRDDERLWDAVWAERRFVSDYERAFLRELRRQAPEAALVLEAGCGCAGILKRMLNGGRWRAAVGLDLSEEGLALAAKERPDTLHLVQGDLFRLPFDAGTFDLVYNSGVIEHFDDEKLEEALRAMARVTRPGGRVLAVVPNAACLWYRWAKAWLIRRGRWRFGFERHLSARAMRRFARRIGLEHVRTRAVLLFPPACDGYRMLYPRWIRRVFDVFETVLAPLARVLGYALIVTGTKGETTQ
ncbi:MAG: class I SAM-dependent methyltransferase [Verrucomicrobia bacterium]|nr:class I SAM-dependent methyltransferase [Verrucomicrobiota bacterium]